MRLHLIAIAAASMLACGTAFAQGAIIDPPEQQLKFGNIVEEFASKYDKASNELKASEVVSQRNEAWKTVVPGGKFSNWLFKIEELGTTGDGRAYVTFWSKGWPFKLKTWNNAVSDIGGKTLVRQGTPLYEKLSNLSKGQLVYVSGQMIAAAGMTERGKMVDPEFIIRISDVSPWREGAAPPK